MTECEALLQSLTQQLNGTQENLTPMAFSKILSREKRCDLRINLEPQVGIFLCFHSSGFKVRALIESIVQKNSDVYVPLLSEAAKLVELGLTS